MDKNKLKGILLVLFAIFVFVAFIVFTVPKIFVKENTENAELTSHRNISSVRIIKANYLEESGKYDILAAYDNNTDLMGKVEGEIRYHDGGKDALYSLKNKIFPRSSGIIEFWSDRKEDSTDNLNTFIKVKIIFSDNDCLLAASILRVPSK